MYPIVFLCRQYMELALERLIADGTKLFHAPSETLTGRAGHDLVAVWKRCRLVLKKAWPDSPRLDLDVVEDCLAQFAEADPNSTAFRYPVGHNGDPSLRGMKHVNLRSLFEIMSRLESFLDSVGAGIDARPEAEEDIESAYR